MLRKTGVLMAGYTLLLSDDWDICTDAAGNIALCSGAYGIAQHVANAVRLFTKDAYFDQSSGIPHFDLELGHVPSLAALRSHIRTAALSVEGVASVDIVFLTFSGRTLSGELHIVTSTGEALSVAL